jgi:hypothetical protein
MNEMQSKYNEVYLLNFVRVNREFDHATIDGASPYTFFLARNTETEEAAGVIWAGAENMQRISGQDFHDVMDEMINRAILKEFNKSFRKRRKAPFMSELLSAAISRDASDFELENNVWAPFVGDNDEADPNDLSGFIGIRVLAIDFESFEITDAGNFKRDGDVEPKSIEQTFEDFQSDAIEWSMVFQMN